MKGICTLILLTLVVFTMSATPLTAQTDHGENFTTTFPFYAGNTLMPPGYYIARLSAEDSTILTIQSKDGHHNAILDFVPSYADQADAHTDVTFRRYGTTEFLHRIWLVGQRFGMVILPTKMETKMNDHGTPQEHSIPGNAN